MWLRVSTKRNLQALEDVSGWSQVYLSSSIDFRCEKLVHTDTCTVYRSLTQRFMGTSTYRMVFSFPWGKLAKKGRVKTCIWFFYFFASNLSVLSKAVSLFPTSTTFQRHICCISRAWNLHSIVHEMLSTLEDVAIFIIFLEYTYIFF